MAEPITTDFDPFSKGELYDQHCDRWELEQDTAEPTLDILASGKHLPRFSDKEADADYAHRSAMSVPLDLCQDAVRIRIDNIWRTSPVRSVKKEGKHSDLIKTLIRDADNDGTPLDDFMRRVAWDYYTTGADVVTQVTAADLPEEPTKADVKAAGVRPYFLCFNPLQRFDWAANGSGNYLWARFCLGRDPVKDEKDKSGGAETLFLTLTGESWRKWRSVEKTDDSGETVTITELEGEGTHGLRRPPIIKVFFQESHRPGQGGVPISLISRAAVVARVAMNLKSQADIELLAAVPRWMFTGTDEPPTSYGPGTLWSTKDPNSTLQVVQGNVNHIVEKRNWLVLYLLEILRLMKFRGGMGDVEGNQASGIKLALEMTDLQNELRATAAFFERVELEMMRQAVSLMTGEVIEPHDANDVLGYQANYNRDFVLEPVADMLANIKTFVKDCDLVAEEMPEMVREMLRQLSNLLVRDGSPVAEKIRDEIKNASLSGLNTGEPGE